MGEELECLKSVVTSSGPAMFDAEAKLHDELKEFGGPRAPSPVRKKLKLPKGATEWFVLPKAKLGDVEKMMEEFQATGA